MKLIFICSPFSGNVDLNTLRARRYARFAYIKGYVPYAPHLHNPQFLDENIPEERNDGIKMGLEILKHCDEIWCFVGVLTNGMEEELKFAFLHDITIKYFTEKCEDIKV